MFYIPRKLPRNALITSLLMFIAAAALFLVSEFFNPRLAYQLLALAAVSFAIFLVSRYALTDYKYVIKDIDGPDQQISFTIVKINGKREAIMANFNLDDAYALEKLTKVSDFEAKHGKVNKLYNYKSNFMPSEAYMLAIKFNAMNVLFEVELSNEFANEIRLRMPNSEEIANIDNKSS